MLCRSVSRVILVNLLRLNGRIVRYQPYVATLLLALGSVSFLRVVYQTLSVLLQTFFLPGNSVSNGIYNVTFVNCLFSWNATVPRRARGQSWRVQLMVSERNLPSNWPRLVLIFLWSRATRNRSLKPLQKSVCWQWFSCGYFHIYIRFRIQVQSFYWDIFHRFCKGRWIFLCSVWFCMRWSWYWCFRSVH